MKKHVYRLGGLALAVSLLTGCVEMRVGRPIDTGKIAEIKPGRTKKAEVIASFGAPLRTVTGTDNEIAVYRYLDGEGAFQELIVSYYQDTVSECSSQ